MIKKIFVATVFLNFFAQANKVEQNIALSKGETTTIQLESNPTTGFSWYLSPLNMRNSTVAIEELPYEPSQTGLAGSGGIQSWNITGLKRGTAHIKFEYKRSWEKNIRPAKLKRYLFTVN